MTTLRAAAQQALEAAENRLPLIGQAAIIDELNALRAALAQPEQEPVAWECKAGGLKPLTQAQYDNQTDNIKRHYSRIPHREWQGLTDYEINNFDLPESGTVTIREFVRIIEAKLKEKNA